MIPRRLPQGARIQGSLHPPPVYPELGRDGPDAEPLVSEVGDFLKKLFSFHARGPGPESVWGS